MSSRHRTIVIACGVVFAALLVLYLAFDWGLALLAGVLFLGIGIGTAVVAMGRPGVGVEAEHQQAQAEATARQGHPPERPRI
ncbi:hypothetical protein [Ornithinimicrobium sp. Y1694]